MLAEQWKGVYQRIGVAEQSVDALTLAVVDGFEVVCRDLLILFDERFGHDEFLHTVAPRVLIGLFACHPVLAHRVAHLECGIDKDAVVAV